MPFRLTNILALKQELINNIYKDILDKYIIIYLNNTLVYSNKTLKNHIRKVHEVLKYFNKKNLKLKPKKCRFHQKEIKFLGYIIRKNGIYINPRKIALVKRWLRPINIIKAQLFLEFTNFNK